MAINGLTSTGVQGRVQSAIAFASEKTGVDFGYLLGQAQVESSLRADARAATSSATGLFQFIDQSWLAVVKRHGKEHGLGWAADSISQGANGRFSVGDSATRSAILNLRTDPAAASLMAAEHAADNKAQLEAHLGRPAGATDLYMAHFLGIGGAKQFLGAMAANPERGAASLFPAAARANRSIFYGPNGPRSLSEIYERFAGKIQRGTALAGGGNILPAIAAPSAPAAVAASTAAPSVEQMLARRDEPDSLLRPTPESARLAYMMLASLGA